jgi:hypothetical protein
MAQGTFQNLDFEDAIYKVPDIPGGQFGTPVSAADGIPGWTAYYGTDQVSQILHNNIALGATSISIMGPNWTGPAPLQGFYSVLLQSPSGISPISGPAAIAQTGTIPANALSIQFLGLQILDPNPAQLGVTFGGHSLSLVPLSSGPGATLYGADISAYAGNTGQLEITSLPNPDSSYNSFMIDSISFSPQAIPEPSTVSLLVIGAAIAGHLLAVRRR